MVLESLENANFLDTPSLKWAWIPLGGSALNTEGLVPSPLSLKEQLWGCRLRVQNLLDGHWGMHNVIRVQNLCFGPAANEK